MKSVPISVPIRVTNGLPFVTARIYANGQVLQIEHVLLDTGSSTTTFQTDHLITLGIGPQPADRLRFLRGIGGDEAVIEKTIGMLQVGDLSVTPFTIQIGALDYGILIDGILGLDFLLQTQAIINLKTLELYALTLNLDA